MGLSDLIGGLLRRPDKRGLVSDFLRAAEEQIAHQGAFLDLLRTEHGIEAYEYFIGQSWEREMRNTGTPPLQDGLSSDGQWQWFAHGLCIDFEHQIDGRRLRLDFGPGGRTDVFTVDAVARFACASRTPWGSYPDLRAYLLGRDAGPDFERYMDIGDIAFEQGLTAYAAPDLVQLRERFTRIDDEGFTIVDVPAEYSPAQPGDLLLCDRLVVTRAGHDLNVQDG